MEGLIKGLVDVALGADRRRDDDDEAPRQNSRDERSRSSWAEVVSGEQAEDQEQDRLERPHDDNRNRRKNDDKIQHGHDQYGREEGGERPEYEPNQWKQQKEVDEGKDESETVGRKPARQQDKENQEETSEGWETVGKRKPSRQPHKVHMEFRQEYKRPPSEQQYTGEDEISSNLEPSEEELADLSRACNKLWELDYNRIVPGKDYEIDIGDGKKPYQRKDMAAASLFSWVSEDVFRKPTFARFLSLLDNYNPDEGYKEVVTAEEEHEEAAFVEEISRTSPIKYLFKYLSSKGVVNESYGEFKTTLTRLWFDLYARGGTSGSSSAFEHVFVGEIKQRGGEKVSGFHNWLQFYLEEAKGRVDYQGYIFPRRRGEILDSESQLLTIQFEWNGVLKSVSSTLVGASPEFEVALYTLCFFMGEEDNHVQLGPYSVNIKCYRLGNKIGSAFPIADS